MLLPNKESTSLSFYNNFFRYNKMVQFQNRCLQNVLNGSGVQAASAPVASFRCRAKFNHEANSKLSAGTARAGNPFLAGLPRQKLVEAVPAKSVRRAKKN